MFISIMVFAILVLSILDTYMHFREVYPNAHKHDQMTTTGLKNMHEFMEKYTDALKDISGHFTQLGEMYDASHLPHHVIESQLWNVYFIHLTYVFSNIDNPVKRKLYIDQFASYTDHYRSVIYGDPTGSVTRTTLPMEKYDKTIKVLKTELSSVAASALKIKEDIKQAADLMASADPNILAQ